MYAYPIRTHQKTDFICILICMADLVAHYDGTNAAQILIILPKQPTIVTE